MRSDESLNLLLALEMALKQPGIRFDTISSSAGMGSAARRMHNKSFTVDNQVTILGGRNIGSEHFEADADLAFADNAQANDRGTARRKERQRGSSRASLRAESFASDRRQVFIDSLNLDPRALFHNTDLRLLPNPCREIKGHLVRRTCR